MEGFMIITSTEFQNKVGEFLQKVSAEDIVITKNGKEVARLIGANKSVSFLTDSLIGIIPQNTDIQNGKQEYFEDKYGVSL
jgi:prevent-host-death family protein